MVILSRIRRVASQAKNICEETIFAVSGQTKKRKPVRILFLDEDNGIYSRTAVALARKAFPNTGRFVSAGLNESQTSIESYMAYLTTQGCTPPREVFRSVEFEKANLNAYDVVISLQVPMDRFLTKIPFHTVSLEWTLPTLGGENEDQKMERFQEIQREIAAAVNHLMTTMRGEEAD